MRVLAYKPMCQDIDLSNIFCIDVPFQNVRMKLYSKMSSESLIFFAQLKKGQKGMGITHTDSKMAPSMPTFPLGVTPKPPINPAQRSLQKQTQIGKIFIKVILCQ